MASRAPVRGWIGAVLLGMAAAACAPAGPVPTAPPPEEGGRAGPPPAAASPAVLRREAALREALAGQGPVEVRRTGAEVQVVLDGAWCFPSAGDQVAPEVYGILDRLAQVLLETPGVGARVEYRAGPAAAFPAAQRRAEAVKRLLAVRGLPRAGLTAVGRPGGAGARPEVVITVVPPAPPGE
ncbi:hypothetical protein [Dissulfurirhabdus thermomarina]|nr:hypothetical protein [Dissulfurirhabdus thermomarina]